MALPKSLQEAVKPVTIVTGHYGVGKTNLTLNMARDLAAAGFEVRVADLDIVNPYFRSSEYGALLEEAGVSLVAPVMANSSLDTPSLSAAIEGSIEWAREDNRILLIDVGGDDAGATALGRYTHLIDAERSTMVYVINAYRNLTQDPAEAVEILKEIEFTARMKAQAIVNNSHLHNETDVSVVEGAQAFGEQVAEAAGIPLVAQTAPAALADKANITNCYPVQKLVKTPWE